MEVFSTAMSKLLAAPPQFSSASAGIFHYRGVFAVNCAGSNLGISQKAHLSGEFFSVQASSMV
jgi:hypothetical protein